MVQPHQAHNHRKILYIMGKIDFRFDDENDMSYKYILTVIWTWMSWFNTYNTYKNNTYK